jgi:hypothetical protein
VKSRLLVAVVAMLLWAAPAFAQGCAMCAQSREAASAESRRAMQRAVLVLLVPTLLILGVGARAISKYRPESER